MLGRYPFGAQPVSGIALEDSSSTQNPLIALLADPHTDFAFLMRGRPYDRELGAERDVFLSGHGYATYGGGDAAHEGIPDHTHFPDILISPFNVKVSLLSGGAWQPSAIPGYGAAVLADPEGQYEDLIKLDWEQREVTVWVGRKKWIGPSFKAFGRAFTGTVEAITWDADRKSLHLRDLRHLFEQDVNPEAYLGFGTAARFRAAGDSVVVTSAPSPSGPGPGGGWRFVAEILVSLPALVESVLLSKGGDTGALAKLYADGSLGFFDRGLTNYILTAPATLTANRPTRLGFYGDETGLRIAVDGVVVADNAVPFGATANAEALVIGRRYAA